MESEVGENENEAFYEEIRRQILLLISEDEEFDHALHAVKQLNSRSSSNSHTIANNSTKSLRSASFSTSTLSEPQSYFNWWENEGQRSNLPAVPIWLLNLWECGSGTGVFIPKIVKSSRRYNNKHEGLIANRRRIYKCISPDQSKC